LLLSNAMNKDVEALHGDIAQNQREVTMKRFKENKFQVLVATDVASRGLDIPDVELVIQLEPPKDTESYIHRSGRTARAGKSGTCITFYNHKSVEFLNRIEQLAGIKFEQVGIPSDADIQKAQSKDVLRKLEDVDPEVLPLFDEVADKMLAKYEGDSKLALKVALAFCSGHYKHHVPTKSLLTGKDGFITIQMTVDQGRQLNEVSARAIIEKYWNLRVLNSISSIKEFRDSSGVAFDLKKELVEGFIENFKLLQERESQRVDFSISMCSERPDVEGFGGAGFGGRRNDHFSKGPRNDNGGSNFGGKENSNFGNSNFGNSNNYGGDRDFKKGGDRQPRDRSSFGNNQKQPFGSTFSNNRNTERNGDRNFNGGQSKYRSNSAESGTGESSQTSGFQQPQRSHGNFNDQPSTNARRGNYNDFKGQTGQTLEVNGPIIYLMNISFGATE